MGLKAIDFLSIIDFNSQPPHPSSSPGRQHRVFPERRARLDFDSFTVENVAPPTVSALDGKSDSGSDDSTKQSMRASPIPRPRAVLSSPSNDAMIGKKNKKLMEKNPNPASRIANSRPHPPGNAAHQKVAAATKPFGYCSPKKNAKTPRETADQTIARVPKGTKASPAKEPAGLRTHLHIGTRTSRLRYLADTSV
ncbi:hypothetical protein MLD38_039534 [Melastoma candidum]|uniref:Uncharacterized protein n=1 Tax=Melastoma candidum TaxID=119954 RepID=A0ACB9L4Q5_9MYRT|nr:hypothetical protein MLD38_039534 [Melastoma candidum]